MSKRIKKKNEISAEIIADSLMDKGHRMTSFVLTFPRHILAEVNTHKILSKNSASSRAIPFNKMVKNVKTDPFIPIKWMKDHKGMQGSQYFEGFKAKVMRWVWLLAKSFAVFTASWLNRMGLSKQFCNRILEPFAWHTIIITGTEWTNFFALRAHEAAEIHIAKLAEKMLEAYNTSTPTKLKEGEWHIPFGDKIDDNKLYEIIRNQTPDIHNRIHLENQDSITIAKLFIATARCARVSYINYVGKDDYNADFKLVDSLASLGHFSPFEHCGRAMSKTEYKRYNKNYIDNRNKQVVEMGWSKNLRGFIQLRSMIDNENIEYDERIKI